MLNRLISVTTHAVFCRWYKTFYFKYNCYCLNHFIYTDACFSGVSLESKESPLLNHLVHI